jgi:enediyne core biosynthesis thioesterase
LLGISCSELRKILSYRGIATKLCSAYMQTQFDIATTQCDHGISAKPYFAYRRIVSLEDTNATGNVYFAQYVKWQGNCREMFLKLTGDWVVRELGSKYALVTTWCRCDYYIESQAFDEICMHLYLSETMQNRMTMEFEYWRVSGSRDELVARGSQQIAWLERNDAGHMQPRPVPPRLLAAIDQYIAAKYGG